MKKIYLLLFTLVSSPSAFSQQYEWATANTLNYNLNPSYPVNIVCANDNGTVFTSHTDSSVLIYGVDIFGKTGIDCYNALGALQWSISLGNKVVVSEMVTDENGNVFIGGSYMETMLINETEALLNTGDGFDINTFLLCFNADGNLNWKRNVSLEHPAYTHIAVMTIDQQQNPWYGASDFFSGEIFKLDDAGNDLQSYSLTGAKTLGGISFDPEGNLFISGAAGTPAITIANLTKTVPEPYMMFVTRINAAGIAEWVQLASDVTFQSPLIKADQWGNAYVSGPLLSATAFGNVSFLQPQWVYDIFITRVDKDGNFKWGVQGPQSIGSITGDFSPGSKGFMDIDDAGHVFVTGVTRGTLDWGNNVVSGGAAISFGTLSTLSFDTSGNALWALNGGSEAFNQANSLSAVSGGDCYFSASVIDVASFGSIVVNSNDNYASVFGKISAGLSTETSTAENNFSLALFPNPAHDFIQVNFSLQKNSNVKIELSDLQGKVQRTFSEQQLPAAKYSFQLSIADVPKGIYFLHLKTTAEMITKKVVVN